MYSLNRFKEAIQMYDEALKIDPKYALAYIKKGRSINIIKIINRLFVE